MTLLGAAFTIEVDELLVGRDMLGEKVTAKLGEDVWQIQFPSGPDDFPRGRATGHSDPPDPREAAPVALLDSGGSMVDVRLIELLVNFPYDGVMTADGFVPDRDHDEHYRLVKEYEQKALNIVSDLCANLRLSHRQPWIEPSGQYPKTASALSLIDVEAGRYFPVQILSAPRIRIVERTAPLEAADIPDLRAAVEKGSLDPEQLLLSEAIYLAWDSPRASPDRATLLAAIAVELRTKRTLANLAGTDRAGEADLLIVSMSAHGLFQRAVPLFAGVEPDPDYAQTAGKVQKLLEARNMIAHRGKAIAADEAREHIKTATAAFACLEGISAQQSEVHTRRRARRRFPSNRVALSSSLQRGAAPGQLSNRYQNRPVPRSPRPGRG